MPISIDGQTFQHFESAENYVRKHKPDIKSPGGYVKTIEERQQNGNLIRLPAMELESTNGEFATYFFVKGDMENGRHWGVTDESVPQNIYTGIGQPAVVTSNEYVKDSVYGPIWDHPSILHWPALGIAKYGSYDPNDLNLIERWQNKFRVGIMYNFYQKDGVWRVNIKKDKKYERLPWPPFCSPSLYKLDDNEPDDRMTKWLVLHLALLKEKPAYGDIALFKASCSGSIHACDVRLREASSGSLCEIGKLEKEFLLLRMKTAALVSPTNAATNVQKVLKKKFKSKIFKDAEKTPYERLQDKVKNAAEFHEEDHPRDDEGQFTCKECGSAVPHSLKERHEGIHIADKISKSTGINLKFFRGVEKTEQGDELTVKKGPNGINVFFKDDKEVFRTFRHQEHIKEDDRLVVLKDSVEGHEMMRLVPKGAYTKAKTEQKSHDIDDFSKKVDSFAEDTQKLLDKAKASKLKSIDEFDVELENHANSDLADRIHQAYNFRRDGTPSNDLETLRTKLLPTGNREASKIAQNLADKTKRANAVKQLQQYMTENEYADFKKQIMHEDKINKEFDQVLADSKYLYRGISQKELESYKKTGKLDHDEGNFPFVFTTLSPFSAQQFGKNGAIIKLDKNKLGNENVSPLYFSAFATSSDFKTGVFSNSATEFSHRSIPVKKGSSTNAIVDIFQI